MLKMSVEYERDISLAKFTVIYRQVYPGSPLDVAAGIC
jgi:hypothetical protein